MNCGTQHEPRGPLPGSLSVAERSALHLAKLRKEGRTRTTIELDQGTATELKSRAKPRVTTIFAIIAELVSNSR